MYLATSPSEYRWVPLDTVATGGLLCSLELRNRVSGYFGLFLARCRPTWVELDPPNPRRSRPDVLSNFPERVSMGTVGYRLVPQLHVSG